MTIIKAIDGPISPVVRTLNSNGDHWQTTTQSGWRPTWMVGPGMRARPLERGQYVSA
jgi:hypothetical protein